MKEFGSDFHYIANTDFLTNEQNQRNRQGLYANGRQAIQHLITFKKWDRIWIPEYFCYEIVEAIKSTGIQVMFYPDAPGLDDTAIVEKLCYEKNDVLLRMNFFGLRSYRDNSSIPIEVIEDHSHDIKGNWVCNSNADWCFASIRKTLPVPEGGVLWSPKQHRLPEQPVQTEENISLAEKRWKAMKFKRDYLQNNTGSKDDFRELYFETENAFEKLPLSDLTEDCKAYLVGFDISSWSKQKNRNWKILSEIQSDRIQILLPEDKECYVFSFVFLLNTEHQREQVRQYLIKNKLYPVVLWSIPEENSRNAVNFSKRMLSIPCDARYTGADITEMRYILEKALQLTQA